MNKMIFAALAVASTVVFAGESGELAETAGYYDVTLTTKRLANVEKVVTKTFKTKGEVNAYDLFVEHYNSVKDYAGFRIIDVNGKATFSTEEIVAKKIVFKYAYYNFKVDKNTKEPIYLTKVVSDSSKGVYDAEDARVYLWSTAKDAKITVPAESELNDSKKAKSGFVAYEVPLAIDKQFVAADDGKAAGGFTGAKATAKDGTVLDFTGFTAFGTGTVKNDELYSVAGNVAMKQGQGIKTVGAYGTWKLQQDASAKTKKAKNIQEVLRNKGCVELFMETEDK